MAWDNMSAFAPYNNNDIPSADEFNIFMANIMYLWGGQAGQTVIEIEKPVRVPALGFQDPQGYIAATDSNPVVTFTANNLETGSNEPPHGVVYRLILADSNNRETLAEVEFFQQGAGSGVGTIRVYLYKDGVKNTNPALLSSSSNACAINSAVTALGGVHVDARGLVRADSFLVAGSPFGTVWTDEGDGVLSWAGDAEIDGAATISGLDGEAPLEVLSSDECTNINAQKLNGFGWGGESVQGSEAVGVTHDGTTYLLVAAATVTKLGYYWVKGSITVDVTAANVGLRFSAALIRGGIIKAVVSAKRGTAGKLNIPVEYEISVADIENDQMEIYVGNETGQVGDVVVTGQVQAEWIAEL